MVRCFAFIGFLACSLVGQAGQLVAQETQDSRKTLVCSTTQVADFARQVVGDRMRVLCVLGPGQDPHLYELKPGDSRMVAQADLCLENGWHLEGNNWMQSLARDAAKPIVTCVTGIKPINDDADNITFLNRRCGDHWVCSIKMRPGLFLESAIYGAFSGNDSIPFSPKTPKGLLSGFSSWIIPPV